MDRISALGVALSLDDFGTGYSSLSYLKRFPIDTLKIDRSFTTGIPLDPSDCAIASTIIGMGRKLGHRVIAEGVETLEQLEFLRQAGCDEVQGYLYGKPLPAYEFEKSLRENWMLMGLGEAESAMRSMVWSLK
jgi:EAL domain-containing protein (putative c-di-GMP-specific phosphodiesterase class I)